jgi:hypothetical protein
VSPDNTIALSSAAGTNSQTPCVSTAITNITYATTGATGATVTGLPAGTSGVFTGNAASGVVTISGTPSASGTFNYTVTLTGVVCTGGTITATGLTFTLRKAVYQDNVTGAFGTTWNTLEVWSAPATAIQSAKLDEANKFIGQLENAKKLFEIYKTANVWPFNTRALTLIVLINVVQIVLTAKQLLSLLPA